MKMVIAIVRPERLELVEDALRKVLDEEDFYRLTVDIVEGHGRQEGEVELFRGREVRPRRVEKARLTICVNDEYVQKAIDAIIAGARTEAVGDGKIFVVPLDEVVRIRTGERGGQAI
jgi:nitrogen regulatory protein P-II 1